MMKKSLVIWLIFSLVGLATVNVTAQSNKILVTSVNMTDGDLSTLDPALTDSRSLEIVNQLFVGLTTQDAKTGEVTAGIIESMTLSPNKLTYTFKLLPNIAWVHYNPASGAVEQALDGNGAARSVTAQDVVDSLLRALNPANALPQGQLIAPFIAGGLEYFHGQGALEGVQVRALDALTVELVASTASSVTASMLTSAVARPIPLWAVNEGRAQWTEVASIYSNGPFALKVWEHGQFITLIKNPFWQGTAAIPPAKLDEITFKLLDPSLQFSEYQAGTLDAINVQPEHLPTVQNDVTLSRAFSSGKPPCLTYLAFNTASGPTANVHIRRAFSYTIDRDALVKNISKGGESPAFWFTRANAIAAPIANGTPEWAASYNPDWAKRQITHGLVEAGMTLAQAEAQLALAYPDRPENARLMLALQQIWQETLGIHVNLLPLDPVHYLEQIRQNTPAIFRMDSCEAYGDAHNALYDNFASTSALNLTHFNNPEFDRFVSQARIDPDLNVRQKIYARAETILVVSQAVIAPLYRPVTRLLTKPYVQNVATVLDTQAYYLWDVTR